MDIVAIAALAFAPGIFWLWYFYRRDVWEPEPKLLVLRTFFWGMLIAVPAAGVEMMVAEPLALVELQVIGKGFWLAVVAAPVIEEYLKFLVVRYTIYRHPEFDEPMDGIVYAAAAALGFASVENALYLVGAYLNPQPLIGSSVPASPLGSLLFVFTLRALLSVPGHVLFSCMWGYALGWAKFRPAEQGRSLVRKGLLLAMALHAAFNGLQFLVPVLSFVMLIAVLGMWRAANRRIADALEGSPHKRGRE